MAVPRQRLERWRGSIGVARRGRQPDAGMRWATEAQRLALAYDQPELAQAIARHIASLR